MIKHIVMWKLRAEAEGNTSAINAQLMKEKLEALPTLIPELESAEVGIHMFDDRNEAVCDVVLTAICKDENALQSYAQHPEHVKVVDFIKKVVNERRVTDYSI
ncbi:MAG: Dabb family protein [Balneolaceae bacterium]|nr:Dabb family protein [Balneolaceae bacterium]